MNTKTVSIGTLALLSQVSSGSSFGETVIENRNVFEPSFQKSSLQVNLNQRDLLEVSWLKVPHMCKDRSFPFVPQKVTGETTVPALAALYEALA